MTNHQRFFSEGSMGSATKQQRRLPQLLEQIRDHAINELKALFTKMLDGADDALFDQADKARSNKDQSLYFDSMRELRVKRQGMEKVFSQELVNNFQKLQKSSEPVSDASLDELPLDNFSLVQEDELEENLAIDSMVAKADNKNEQALKQIVTRFDTLLANVRVDNTNNPVSPRNICESFREASHALELDIKAKLIVYKLFDRLVVSEFTHLYDGVNENLVKNGVLPDLPGAGAELKKKQAERKRAGQQARQQQAQQQASEDSYIDENGDIVGGGGEIAASSGSGTDIGTEVLGALRDLLAVQRTGGITIPAAAGQAVPLTPSGEAVALAPPVDNRQLIQALSTVQADIQQQGATAAGYIPVSDLRGQIGTVLPVTGPVSSNSIGQANDDVIDIISMLFDFILDDKNLPDEFKALIGRLQIPMLKVALLDDTFFSKGNHPARKLLNEMARAGIGWQRDTNGGGVGLRDKVEEIVMKILNEFEDDISLFSDCLEDFHNFNKDQSKRSDLVEKRIREAEEGKAKSETAKSKSEEALKKIVGNKQLPEAVGRLMYEAWQSVLLLIYLREGDSSDAWKKHLLTAEELVESLTPPTNIEARKRLTGILPGLVKSIKAGLDAVAYGEFESAQLFQELEQIHLKVLKGEKVLGETPTGEVAAEDVPDEVDALKEELANIDTQDESDSDDVDDFSDDLDFEGFEDEHEISAANKKKIKEMDLAQITGSMPIDLDSLGGIEEIDMSVNPPANYIESNGSLPEDDQFQALVETFQVGGWFELEVDVKAVRCKLAAIIPTVGKYIFVNRTGVKVADYTKSGLAIALRRKEITQLNDGALFDRALESIVSNLRSLKKTQDEGI